MNTNEQVARYFGFAQQVGLELGEHMPEGLRHTMGFVSSLVTMTLNLDQVSQSATKLSFVVGSLFAFVARSSWRWCDGGC